MVGARTLLHPAAKPLLFVFSLLPLAWAEARAVLGPNVLVSRQGGADDA